MVVFEPQVHNPTDNGRLPALSPTQFLTFPCMANKGLFLKLPTIRMCTYSKVSQESPAMMKCISNIVQNVGEDAVPTFSRAHGVLADLPVCVDASDFWERQV